MQANKAKKPFFKQMSAEAKIALISMAVAVLLLAAVCIISIMRTNIQRRYEGARNEIGIEMYNQMYMVVQTFDQFDVPGQDVQYDLLPSLRQYYLAGMTLNEALSGAFGSGYTLIDAETNAAMESAFDAYETAYRTGRDTLQAETALSAAVDRIRSLLGSRYRGDVLIPA